MSKELVKLPKNVAEVIGYLRSVYQENVDILSGVLGNADSEHYLNLKKYTQTNFDTFLQALVNGYDVEITPEDKVKEYYDKMQYLRFDLQDNGDEIIRTVLNLLNIKIEGVNT